MKAYKTLRILVVTPTYGLSGVPLAQSRLAKALAEEGHNVTLMIGNNNQSFTLEKIPFIRRIILNKSRVIAMFFPILKYFLSSPIDVVFTAEDHLNTVVLAAAILSTTKAKIVCSSRVTPYDTFSDDFFTKRWVLKILVQLVSFRADLFTCVSQDMVSQYKQIFPSSSHVCVYNIIATQDSLKSASEPVDHPWLSKKSKPVFIAAGMLEPWKGFDTLVQAFAAVLKVTPSRLIILGDGSQKARLLDLAKELGISEYVDFPGYTYNPYSYFSKADIFVLSSRVEGMPNVLIEAMLCGCTPVSTNCPTGPSEVLKNEKYGYLCPVGNVSAMTDKLLLALSSPLPQKLLREGITAFTKRNVLDVYGKLIKYEFINPDSGISNEII